MKEPRISFSIEHAEHLYELALEHFCDGCSECELVKGRLEKFLGPARVKAVTKTIKKNGYCNKLRKKLLLVKGGMPNNKGQVIRTYYEEPKKV